MPFEHAANPFRAAGVGECFVPLPRGLNHGNAGPSGEEEVPPAEVLLDSGAEAGTPIFGFSLEEREKLPEEWTSQGHDLGAVRGEAERFFEIGIGDRLRREKVGNGSERAGMLVRRQTDFYSVGIDLETEVTDNRSVFVLLGGLYEAKLTQDFVEHRRGRSEIMIAGEDCEEVVQVVCDRPTMRPCEDPVYCFCEQVEDARGCPKAKREEELDIVHALPFEDKAPLIENRNGDVPEGGFQVSLDHFATLPSGSNEEHGVRQGLVRDGAKFRWNSVVH